MYKKIITICILLVWGIGANAKEFPICKDYYSINEGEKEKKEKFLEKVLKSDPQNVECMLKLASVYLRTGKVSQGFDLITVAYKLKPKFVKNAKISKILDLALRMSSLRERANKSKDYKLWNELADTYFDIGIFKEAAIAYEYSIELNPNQTYKKILLAVCYGNLNQYKKASQTLKSILKQQNDNFYANYYYAKLLKNEFDDRRWIKYMKQARKLVDKKVAMFNSEEEREYIKEDIESELKN
jgi:cytochrome c-type biogenesis protein CcmH/NrfG